MVYLFNGLSKRVAQICVLFAFFFFPDGHHVDYEPI